MPDIPVGTTIPPPTTLPQGIVPPPPNNPNLNILPPLRPPALLPPGSIQQSTPPGFPAGSITTTNPQTGITTISIPGCAPIRVPTATIIPPGSVVVANPPGFPEGTITIANEGISYPPPYARASVEPGFRIVLPDGQEMFVGSGEVQAVSAVVSESTISATSVNLLRAANIVGIGVISFQAGVYSATFQRLEEIYPTLNSMVAECNAIRTRALTAYECSVARDELSQMRRIANLLEQRYRELAQNLPAPPGGRGRIPFGGGAPIQGDAVDRAIEATFGPFTQAAANAEARLNQDCFQFENRAQAQASANPCVMPLLYAIQRAINGRIDARNRTFEDPTLGRFINDLTGAGETRNVNDLRTLQRQLASGAISPEEATQSVASILAALEQSETIEPGRMGPNPTNVFNDGINYVRGQPRGTTNLLDRITAEDGLVRYRERIRRIMRDLVIRMRACPARPQLPCVQPLPDSPPGS